MREGIPNLFCKSVLAYLKLANADSCHEFSAVPSQSGAYHQDVNMAISEAAEYFSNLHTANRSQVVVFDIDETALSNLPVSTLHQELMDALLLS